MGGLPELLCMVRRDLMRSKIFWGLSAWPPFEAAAGCNTFFWR